MCVSHHEAISPPQSVEEWFSSTGQNWALVPKRLGTAALIHPQPEGAQASVPVPAPQVQKCPQAPNSALVPGGALSPPKREPDGSQLCWPGDSCSLRPGTWSLVPLHAAWPWPRPRGACSSPGSGSMAPWWHRESRALRSICRSLTQPPPVTQAPYQTLGGGAPGASGKEAAMAG